jgi:hypothetical protein
MTSKKHLEQLIRGWLPKEANLTSAKLRMKELRIKFRRRNPPTIRDRLVGGLGGGGGALVLMGILNYVLFSWYPKSFIFVEEVVGSVLLVLAFFVWVTDKNRKTNAENSTRGFSEARY